MSKRQQPKKTPEERDWDRRDRFLRLAAARVNKAISALRNVARLGNTSSYSYTQDDVAKITVAINDEVDGVWQAFAPSGSHKPAFTL